MFPQPIPGIEGAIAVSAGHWHTLALLQNGAARAWGNGGAGQLGDGSAQSHREGVKVGELLDLIAVAAGGWHSFALGKSGTIESWGNNTNNQMADGTLEARNAPVGAQE